LKVDEQGIVRKFPIGPISMVSPWNFPLNLVAHKVAPALAVGCTFVLKPSSRTPLSALVLGEILETCELLPKGAFSILPVSREDADMFTVDERFKLLTFTGSGMAGWGMKARAGKKKVCQHSFLVLSEIQLQTRFALIELLSMILWS
jgi:acyl-CoA reductase-like NAD-dependent aldehyde dehydrogenase